jgi:hypothetical protein
MAIKVIVEFQARPGARTELKNMLSTISATSGPTASGFLESAEAQAAAVAQATAAGACAPVVDLVAAPFEATRIGRAP